MYIVSIGAKRQNDQYNERLTVPNVALHKAPAVSKSCKSFRRCCVEQRDKIFLLVDYSHSLTSSTLGGFDLEGEKVGLVRTYAFIY